MVEIHLYGKLRRFSKDFAPAQDVVLALEALPEETLELLLRRVGIPSQEINHIFFNSKLLATRSQVALMYDLPQVDHPITDWKLNILVGDGDRIGLFGTDIPILSM